MILDPTTGIFTLDSGAQLDPGLTRAAFLATSEGQTAEAWAGPHYRFFTTGGTLGLVAYFYPPAWPKRPTAPTDRLSAVDFWLAGPAYAQSWDGWSAERERQQQHDTVRWLAGHGLDLRPIADGQHEAVLPWGKVGIYYDFKDGGFYNRLLYAPPPPPNKAVVAGAN